MNWDNMKSVLLMLMLFGMNCVMAQQNTMTAVLVEEINGYQAKSDVSIDTLEDGSIRAYRNYIGGESSLEIRITQIAASQKEELPKQVQRLTETFIEMASEGRMEAEAQESANLQGILTFFEGTAGAILIVKGAYLVEYQLSGATGLILSRKILKSLNLSAL